MSPGVSAVLYGFVDIGAGRSTAQGPTLPQLHADDGRMGAQTSDPTLAVAFGEATDPDGYLAGFSVDWGDGTPVQPFAGDPLGCIQLANGWPRSYPLLARTPP